MISRRVCLITTMDEQNVNPRPRSIHDNRAKVPAPMSVFHGAKDLEKTSFLPGHHRIEVPSPNLQLQSILPWCRCGCALRLATHRGCSSRLSTRNEDQPPRSEHP